MALQNDEDKTTVATNMLRGVSYCRSSLQKCMKGRSSDPAVRSSNVWVVFTWASSWRSNTRVAKAPKPGGNNWMFCYTVVLIISRNRQNVIFLRTVNVQQKYYALAKWVNWLTVSHLFPYSVKWRRLLSSSSWTWNLLSTSCFANLPPTCFLIVIFALWCPLSA